MTNQELNEAYAQQRRDWQAMILAAWRTKEAERLKQKQEATDAE